MGRRVGVAAWCSLVMNVVIGGLSFMVSFVALWDLAGRSGVGVPWAWPLIVDGLVLAASVGVVALSGGGYAWLLLGCGVVVSLLGNGVHAWLGVGSWVAVGVSLVPPLALVAVTHLSVLLLREGAEAPVPEVVSVGVEVVPEVAEGDPREVALSRLASGAAAKAVALELGVSDRTVRRWRDAAATV